MVVTSTIRRAGVLRTGSMHLKLYLLPGGSLRSFETEPIQRLLRALPLACLAGPDAIGFMTLGPAGAHHWRVAFYAWCDGGLTRIVFEVDGAAGTSRRAPEAAFRVGCLAEVQLIAGELRAWRDASTSPLPAERYLRDEAS